MKPYNGWKYNSLEERREADSIKTAKWRKDNPERIKELRDRYNETEEGRAKKKIYQKKYYSNLNEERLDELRKEQMVYYNANKEVVLKKQKEAYRKRRIKITDNHVLDLILTGVPIQPKYIDCSSLEMRYILSCYRIIMLIRRHLNNKKLNKTKTIKAMQVEIIKNGTLEKEIFQDKVSDSSKAMEKSIKIILEALEKYHMGKTTVKQMQVYVNVNTSLSKSIAIKTILDQSLITK